MSTERLRERVREVRHRLAHDGPPWTRDRANDFETVTVPERDCDALRDLLIAESAETVVEVGLAYGSSALAIGEALVSVGASRPLHVIIDPLQAMEWSNVGWQLLRSAGLDTIARLILQPSSLALPQLIAEGFVASAAFVDGSHRFHEVFVDLYFLRKIVQPGGIIVLDDHWWPSVRTAAHYFELNMGWQVVPGASTLARLTKRPDAHASRRCACPTLRSSRISGASSRSDAGTVVRMRALALSTTSVMLVAVRSEACSLVMGRPHARHDVPAPTGRPPARVGRAAVQPDYAQNFWPPA